MRSLLSTLRDAVRAELWPIPTVALLVALLAGSQLPRLDGHLDEDLPSWLGSVIFNGGPGSAQTVLDAVSSSLITVTSLTFSLTVVTLQLASSQFSPRLLRTFSRDLFVQATLALFLATFVYALAVLRLVRSENGGVGVFVPRISVTVAFLLAVASVFMLVLFLAHLTRTIRVEAMLHAVHGEAVATMRSAVPERRAESHPFGPSAMPVVPGRADVVLARESGFATRIERRSLVRAARSADAVIWVDARPGDFTVRGVAVARVAGRGEAVLGDDAVLGLHDAVAAAVHVGFERTAGQDIGFGLRQITDVANKALSPGINDPTTAVHAIGHLSSLLCDLGERDLGPQAVRDDDDVVRVVLASPDFEELLESAIGQPRRYGAGDPQVVGELYRLLHALACRVPVALHRVVDDQLGRLQATVAAQDFDDTEVAHLAQLHQRVRDRLV